jgi:predicted AAA+ superfamily ATPase
MFERTHLQRLISRIEEPRKFIQVLLGPRQVGKTTLATQLTEKINFSFHFISADSVAASGSAWIEQQWEIARTKMDQENASSFLLIIDEIQKVDNWSEIIKLLWDTDTRKKRNLKVILLGSSRLLLQKGLTESLAGRFEVTFVGHWSFSEMQQAFGWNTKQFVWFGGYPGSALLIQDEKRWKEYITNSLIETSISKDILMLTRIDKPALMRRLFELGCSYSGQLLSYTKIMGQLVDAGNTTTLSHYLQLLDTAGLLTGLEKYTKDIIRKRASSPKFQVYNTALISAQRQEFIDEILLNPEEWGRLVESAVGAHLINYSHTENFKVYYWREGNDEIDFVIEKKGKAIGIEVKSGAGKPTSSVASFQKKMRPEKILLVGDAGLPVDDFLQINPSQLF